MIRALVVDDERLARVGLRRHLADLADVEIVGEAGDGASAVRAIESLEPDLVFLDIRMPGGDGFEVVARVGLDRMPAVIFVTAHDEHAIQAFEADAVDYLLKPVDPARLAEAVARAARRIRSDPEGLAGRLASLLRRLDRSESAGGGLERIPIEADGRYRFVARAEVTRVESRGNYCLLHAGGKVHRLRSTLEAMGARLGARFVRVGKSLLLNADLVDAIEYHVAGRYLVTLRDGSRVETSRHFRRQVAALLR